MAIEVLTKDKEGAEGIEYFGKVDRRPDGHIASHVPGWYLTEHIDKLTEDINYIDKQLAGGAIPDEKRPELQMTLKKMKERKESILESKPNLTDAQKDIVKRTTETIGKKISESMFTRDDMQKGTADAHEEARRIADPCIKLSGDEMILAKKVGAKISTDGEVSRTDAERIWKFNRNLQGLNADTEHLRLNARKG